MNSISKCRFIFLFFLLAASCKVQRNAAGNVSTPSLVMQGPLWGAVWQQKAAEYKALCFQAYNTARVQLDIILKEQHEKPLALVTDIDETILDNSPYQVHSALRNEEYSDSSWMVWTKRVECDTVPGGLSFFQYAKSKGVSVFYITNRLEAERVQTLQELQRWNFPDATNDHLILKAAGSGKGSRRAKVSATHEIVMLFGDNLSDFSSVFDKQPEKERNTQTSNNAAMFGSKFIVLPNIMYGDWEGTLYNYQYTLPVNQKDSVIIGSLRKY
ncbi:MAG: 5'-nucleotidase, lipoprotein e(P4) family [Sphingobacteriales bacterium]|nr:5'-nucleotidase, lipoprotein e(P4) family [Sphingobacteriales bacterium]OJY85588.1 MAG: 5'-nucleotidase, lipoprotein e(P4) family [Sphingobacteriales bacterium 44-15]